MKRRFGFWVGLLAALGLACGSSPSARMLEMLENPTGPGSALGNLSVGADGRLYLSWIEPEGEGHALRFSRWDGKAWSAPRVVAQGTGWFVNWADFPAMTALLDGTLMAHWLAKMGSGTYAYGVQVSTSRDGGATWSPPVFAHRDSSNTEHGFVSWAPMAPGKAGLVWLDGREMEGGGHGHGHGGGGAMTLRFATLSRDGAVGEEVLLDPRVCDCCGTDLVAGADGSLLVAYRDRSEEEVRDISVMRFEGGKWSAPALLHADGWKIAGCPVNGPALAMESPAAVTAWYTVDVQDRGHVRAAFSADAGKTFAAPIELGGANPLGRVDVALLPDGSALVVWLEEVKEGAGEIRLRAVAPSGPQGEAVLVATTHASRSSGFPRLARLGDAVFLAWTEPGEKSRVRTAAYR